MSNPRIFRSIGIGLSLVLLLERTGSGQTTGSIVGRVVDESGAPLTGAAIEATSPSLQGMRTTTSAQNGEYRFPAVPPGAYLVRAVLLGFRPIEKSATITLDATATVELPMQVAATESVAVLGEAPPVDVASTATGTSYTSQVVARLPVERNYADIVRANPGVTPDRGSTQSRSLALSIYGATSAENSWIIDGVNTTSVNKGVQGKAINNEFVQEVEVKTGSYSAEYGRALGGIINVITKSGGNQFHGDGFVYYDNLSWNAKPVVTAEDEVLFDMKTDSYDRTDFGADLGGPLWKDRIWFFAAYDRVVTRSEVSRVFIFDDHVSADDRFPFDTDNDLYSGKLTWMIAAGITLVATTFADPSSESGANQLVVYRDPSTWDSTRDVGGTDYGLRLSQLFGSHALLGLQASRHRDRFALTATETVRVRDVLCDGGTLADPCPRASPENFATGGFGRIVGPLDRNVAHRDQYRGDVNLYLGDHEIKIGGDHQEGETTSTSSFTGGQVVFRANEWGTTYYQHNFFAKSVEDRFTPVAGAISHYRVVDYSAYVQDVWRLAPGLTANVGLRWDAEDVHDFEDTPIIRTRNEWQPRVGISWDPFGDARTKIYAFAGRFYYALPTTLAANIGANQVFQTTYNFDPVSVLPDPSVPNREDTPDPNVAIPGEPVDSGLKGIYQDEYTLGVERLLTSTLTVGLKGTYRRLGNAIEDRCDLDYNAPENDGFDCGIMNPGSNGRLARGEIPGCNGLDGDFFACTPSIPATPHARRLYRGIEFLARKNFSTNLWMQASYIYSSLRGNYDGEVNEDFGQTDPSLNADFDRYQFYHNGYGRLFLDRPHRFRMDGYYVTPFGLSVGLQTWVRSGAPLNKRGYFSADWGSQIQLVPKGYAGRLPTEWESNLTLQYPIRIGPVTVTLLGYVFNLFNNQIATYRDVEWTVDPPTDYPDSLYDPNQQPPWPEYGKITSRQDPRRFRVALRVSF